MPMFVGISSEIWLEILLFVTTRVIRRGLYGEGCKSLGTVKVTIPCPALKKDDLDLSWEEDMGDVLGGCNGDYWPAYTC